MNLFRQIRLSVACWIVLLASASPALAQPSITLDGSATGKPFDGVGAVSGGGATTVLLKDYPQPQRDQILDILFKPNFAASMQTLYVEIGGDGNSTQGSEPTHMRSPTEENDSRGYEWWLMCEAKKRNPAITLDACAWSAPGWVGNGQFWSQDMADYYVKWVKALQTHYGLKLNAIGCRNERGTVTQWTKLFRRTLDANGLADLPIHAFDNPGNKSMWNWIPELASDPQLQQSIAIVSNHCLTSGPWPASVRDTLAQLNKPLWNTEEHVYNSDGHHFNDEFAAALGAVHLFNTNYIERGATKIVNWYLVGSTYAAEPYADQPPAMFARWPWSGHYQLKPIIWSYAHYGQFVKVGWHYLPAGCTSLPNGGSIVTLKSNDADFSIIAETASASATQQVSFKLTNGLARKPLCVWRTTRESQFARQPDITPDASGAFTLTLDPNAIYSLSTLTGQRKGGFDNIPADKPFPLPYFDDFDHYGDPKTRGYLPRYTADIVGVFELAERSDHHGHCLRQVVDKKAQSWAPEWMPYTVIGDENWTDYEISADIHLDTGDWAGVMGRITNTGNGWDNDPDGYYCRLYPDGGVQLYSASSQYKGSRDRQLAIGQVKDWGEWGQWHNLKLRFQGNTISVLVDNRQIITATDNDHTRGLAGLITAGEGTDRAVASFDNLLINTVNGVAPDPAKFVDNPPPLYAQ